MKKLKLDLQGLNAEVLTRSQLKQILGGDGSGGTGGGSGGNSCAHAIDTMSGSEQVWCCGLTQAQAQAKANEWAVTQGFSDVHWCSQSCSQTTSQNCD